jgi:hypothetical protein
MAKTYFRQVPNFDYISRTYDSAYISDFITVKNLFKRCKLRSDIFENLTYFTKYSIIGDERPDDVAYKVYNDPTLDWIILISNNILDIQAEWPLPSNSFESVMLEKYQTLENLYSVKHYETKEVKDSLGNTIIPSGLIVPQLIKDYRVYITLDNGVELLNENYQKLVPYFVEFYDPGIGKEVLFTDIITPITNYQYEIEKEENKRNIYILKPIYLNIVFDDIEDLMTYKKGSEQYVSRTLKKGHNSRLSN